MKMKHSLSLCVIVLLCVSANNGLRAADDYRKSTDRSTDRSITMGAPAKENKASGLIGMDVRNQNDEKLGTIKDLVVDLQSGKVSYAVIDGGGLFKDKLFAVPINAFTASADHKHLILRADKSKMEAAKGFDKDAWPSVSNPEWGAETFWELRPGTSALPSATPQGTLPPRPGNPPNENK
jgi:sporulation protein YlmC with PRC-barrel domain